MPSKSAFEPTLPRFWVLLIGAAAFVWITGSGLPPLVASHFGSGGQADGFMARGDYLTFMLIGAVAIPVLIVIPQRLVETIPPRLINVPNREYWLAPERIDSTLGYLRGHAVWFAAMLTALLCFVHWEVVQANMRSPARLAAQPFVIGLVTYVVAVLLWIAAMIRRFRRRPEG
ncbi:MAG TPA: hypothetical protein VL379_11480 [Pseudomonadales bacterium]|jgi:hypothetical protein|nr:hypothetical protein [Pseudomonadales bacterium]